MWGDKMGWLNYIVVPKWKVMFEISRHVDELPEHIKKAAEKLYDEEFEELYEIQETKFSDLTAGDFAKVMEAVDIVTSLSSITDPAIFLLIFLHLRGMKYEIISEFEFEERKEEFKNFKILEWLDDD